MHSPILHFYPEMMKTFEDLQKELLHILKKIYIYS